MQDPESLAVGRFTRTPIHIYNLPVLYDELNRRSIPYGQTGVSDPYPEPASGEHDPKENKITIHLHQGARYPDVNNVSAHEQIHALLTPNPGDKAPTPQATWRDVLGFGPTLRDIDNLNWNRAGSMEQELPSYMGAYRPGTVEGVTPDIRNMYLDRLRANMPPEKRAIFDRIVKTHDYSLPPSVPPYVPAVK